MPRPKTHDAALRNRLLDRAAELLSTYGPEALSMRRLAGDVGTSTSAVYSLFGGKTALVAELHAEAFRRFGDHLRQVEPSDDPLRDLITYGLAYRQSALDDPHLYAIMFGRPIPGFEPSDEDRRIALSTFEPLIDTVRRCLAEGAFIDAAAEAIAFALWSTAHGMVWLELNGPLPPPLNEMGLGGIYEYTLRVTLGAWLKPGYALPATS